MVEKQQNLQHVILAALCSQQAAVTIFLLNGVRLEGNVAAFDDYTSLLIRDDRPQLGLSFGGRFKIEFSGRAYGK